MADVGPGGVWPAAVLAGAVSAANCSAGAWLVLSATASAPFDFADWIALHALLGVVSGVLVTWLLAAGWRLDPLLGATAQRRAAAVRLSSLGAAAACVCFAFSARPQPVTAVSAAAGLALGAALLLATTRLALRKGPSLAELPRLDPLRISALVALLLVPLQDGVDAPSLAEAWRVMLGR